MAYKSSPKKMKKASPARAGKAKASPTKISRVIGKVANKAAKVAKKKMTKKKK